MIIQMTVQMSGSRYDDRMWPPPWISFEVPDEEGRGLIRAGAAMEVVQVTPDEPLLAATGQGPQIPPYVAAAQPGTGPLTAQEIADAQAATAAREAAKTTPSPADPKSAWVQHAVDNHGVDQADAEAMTKAALQQQFGGRM
jgi:hypothetical protein